MIGIVSIVRRAFLQVMNDYRGITSAYQPPGVDGSCCSGRNGVDRVRTSFSPTNTHLAHMSVTHLPLCGAHEERMYKECGLLHQHIGFGNRARTAKAQVEG